MFFKNLLVDSTQYIIGYFPKMHYDAGNVFPVFKKYNVKVKERVEVFCVWLLLFPAFEKVSASNKHGNRIIYIQTKNNNSC